MIVGLTTAKALALVTRKPLICVNHLEAHALSARLTDGIAFPYLLLLVSGGHTQLVAVKGVGDYVRLGTTMDDAIGEAFDKTAKMLGLPYPGGPQVEKEAERGDPERFALPRPMSGRPAPDFSLSGLKTAVRLEAERIAPLTGKDIADLCASFQAAVIDVMVDRTRVALKLFRQTAGHPSALVVAGGVASNQAVRRALQRLAVESGLRLAAPPPALVHRQWRDDRLGGHRAAAPGDGRRSLLRAARPLAAGARPRRCLIGTMHGQAVPTFRSDRRCRQRRMGNGAGECSRARRSPRDPLDARSRSRRRDGGKP